jgi:CBS domain-containing protein
VGTEDLTNDGGVYAMKTMKHATLAPPMVLNAKTAMDLMTPKPASISQYATVSEAATFLTRRGISAAPVIDGAGRPVGVVSRTDILQHHGERAVYMVGSPEYYDQLERPEFAQNRSSDVPVRRVTVCEVMTPGVFCVALDTAAEKVVEKMLALGVRRIFVVADDGTLVGVVSAVDVLQNLRRWGYAESDRLPAENSRPILELHTAN